MGRRKVRHLREFAVYQGEEIIAFGTAKECAEKIGVSPRSIEFMTTPTAKRRYENCKNPNRARTAVRIDGDDDE